MQRRLIGIVLMVILLLTGCDKKNSILENSVCLPPCWREISPGQKKDLVIDSIKGMDDINENSIKYSNSNRTNLEESVVWSFKGSDNYGSVFFHNGQVTKTTFLLNDKVSLGDAIKLFGEPDKVFIKAGTIEGTYTLVVFIYFNSGICLEHENSSIIRNSNEEYLIDAGKDIITIEFNNPKVEKWPIITGCLNGLTETEYTNLSIDWKGFGKYSTKQ